MNAKAKRQKSHARRRAKDRYGIYLNDHQYNLMVKQIKNGVDCKVLCKQSNRVSLYALKHEGSWLPVVYDKIRHTIVTILPIEALEPYQASL